MAYPPDPIPDLKRQVATELLRITTGWTTTQLISCLRIDQPRISDLRRRRLERFSLERLIRLLHEMHYRIELRISEHRGWAKPMARGGRAREKCAMRQA